MKRELTALVSIRSITSIRKIRANLAVTTIPAIRTILKTLTTLTICLSISTFCSGPSGIETIDAAIVNPKPVLSFAVISDIHLRSGESDWGTPYCDYVAQKKFAASLRDINQVSPCLNGLIINGDLTVTGMQSDYDELHKVLRENPHPQTILYAIGNHEFNCAMRNQNTGKLCIRTFPNGVTEQMCIRRFQNNTRMPGVYYDKWIAGYHFIILGSEQSRITNSRYTDNAVLSETQLQWLEQKLQASPSGKPIFVFLHQPIPYSVAGSNQNDIIPAARLRNILKNYPQVFFFSGHSHQTLKSQPKTMFHQNFSMFNDSSVRNPFLPNHKPARDSEGLFIQVYHKQVVVQGRDFTNHCWIGTSTVPVY